MAIQVRILKEEVAKDPDVLRKHAPAGHFANSWTDAGDVLIVDYEPGHLGPGAAEPAPAAKEKASKSKTKPGGGKKRGK